MSKELSKKRLFDNPGITNALITVDHDSTLTGDGTSGNPLGVASSIITDITTLKNNVYKITYYEIVSGASGSLTVPTGATINAGEFGSSANCVLSKINGSNKPTFISPKTAGNQVVTATLNTSTGAWVTSGTYTDSNVALIYSINISASSYSNLTNSFIIMYEQIDIPIPDQFGNGGKYLTTDGTDPNWSQIDISDISNFRQTIYLQATNTSPLDSTAYLMGNNPNVLLATNRGFMVMTSGTITRVLITLTQGTNATSETVTVYLRNITDATETQIGTFTSDFGANTLTFFDYTSLTYTVTIGKVYALKFLTPAWATNPTTWGIGAIANIVY